MKIVFALVFLISGYLVFRFESLEIWFLEKNFSWTMSKILPYLILVFLGILLAFSFVKAFRSLQTVLKVIVATLLFALPFGVGFAKSPIYDGDFSAAGSEVVADSIQIDEKYQLMVVTIPNCPYCYESIGRMKLLKKQHPELNILYSVCSTEEASIELYKEAIGGDFDIALAPNPEQFIQLAEGHFPTFFYVEKGKPSYRWSNDQFGAGAIDELVSRL